MSGQRVPIHMGSPRFTTVDLSAFRVSEIWFPPDTVLDRHTHSRPVFAIAVEGGLETRLLGDTLPCDSPSIWTEPPEERHGNRVGSAGARVLAILPDPEAGELEWLHRPLFDEVLFRPHGGLASLARRIIAEMEEPDAPGLMMLHGLTLECLAIGVRDRSTRDRAARREPWLERARELVHARFRDNLSIGEIARAVGVEPRRLARRFRRVFGVPLGGYQRRLRLDWAARQLAETDLPLGRLALQAGFYDQSHFTRQFKRHTGQTPGRYRAELTGRGSDVRSGRRAGSRGGG